MLLKLHLALLQKYHVGPRLANFLCATWKKRSLDCLMSDLYKRYVDTLAKRPGTEAAPVFLNRPLQKREGTGASFLY